MSLAARLSALLVTGLALASAVPADAQEGPLPESPLRLLRCMPQRDVACLQAAVTLDASEAAAAAALDSVVEARQWQGRLPGARLVGPNLFIPADAVPPLRLLILMDVSGSMRGEGIAFTRTVLKSFVARLPSGSVEVAVAPFESRGVVAAITRAEFVAPAEAVRRLDALPAPQAAGNTALYSALDQGIARTQARVRESGQPVQGGVLVVTDGRNDVAHPKDDPGLLSGPAGRQAVADRVAASGLRVWLIGVGGTVDDAELRALAGPRGEAYIIKLDPNLLERRLSAIDRQLSTPRELTLGLPVTGSVALARVPARGVVRLQSPSGNATIARRAITWRPPLFAAPAFQGVADSARLAAPFRDLVGLMASPLDRRWPLLVLVPIWVMVVVLVPRLFWTAAGAVPAVDAAAAPAPAAALAVPVPAGAPPSTSGLRLDVTEAPPRRPTDVTAAAARRADKAKSS